MKSKLKDILQKLTPWSVNEKYVSEINRSSESGKFELLFEDRLVGTLSYEDSKWVFEYSTELKDEKFILPLIDFPDFKKVYEFEELVPFFATRIPNLNQPFHHKKLENSDGDRKSLVSLLKTFGAKSINNPFELKYV